jgi:tRNA(fMet)-specific endonuclease VapC
VKYLLDTNTLIYFFKGLGSVAEHIAQHRPADLAISAITLHELEVGLAKSKQPTKQRNQLKLMLSTIAVLPLDADAAIAAAKLRAQLELMGKPIGPMDTLIAGIAMANRATVVTRNTSEFERVNGLQVMNWYE